MGWGLINGRRLDFKQPLVKSVRRIIDRYAVAAAAAAAALGSNMAVMVGIWPLSWHLAHVGGGNRDLRFPAFSRIGDAFVC